MLEMSRAFVHGHTFLHSWSGQMKLLVCLLHGATFLSNLTSTILSLLRVLGIKITRSLPSPSLCQPRTLSEPQASYRSTMPLQVQSHGTSLALATLPLLIVRDSARQQPHPYERSVSNTSSMSLLAWTADGHSHERKKGDSSMVYTLKILSN